jgi:hypothetical protein
MNAIVILCGSNDSGKTSTIDGFFRGKYTLTKSRSHFYERMLDGKRVFAVNSGSPQEIVKEFCNVDLVNKNIENRISECNGKAKSQNYILIIPFTMSASGPDKTKLNKDCILKPIEKLKKSFNVFVIYLKKTNVQNLAEKNELMKPIAFSEIETTEKDYDKSEELEVFLRKNVIKTLT